MKKALLPLLIILAAILVLAAAGYLYDQQFGAEGPFESQHRHGSGSPAGSAADDEHQHNDQCDHHDHAGHDHE